MYRDPKQWACVRRLVLEEGGSRRGVSRKMGLNRTTGRKMLAGPQPPAKATLPNGAEEKLRGSARFLTSRRHAIDPIASVGSGARPCFDAGPVTRRFLASRRRSDQWDRCGGDGAEVSTVADWLRGDGWEYARYTT